MYEKIDQMPAASPIAFYISLIFFLSWLVKNLFIAVVTTSFEMIRAHHFQNFWTSKSSNQADVLNEVLNNSFRLDRDWNLTRQFKIDFKQHFILKRLDQLFQSTFYNYIVIVQILIETIIISSIDFKVSSDNLHTKFHFYAEFLLTFLFISDVLLKMITYSFKTYLKESIHKFELMLAICCLINLIPSVNRFAYFISFKVLRIIRLIRVSPILESFIFRIFGKI